MAADLVDDIKARLNVEDVVGSYVSLRKSGSHFKALSPFQAEKTPSLVVTPAKQIWKDFSSGRGGDVFSFIQAIEGVDFAGSIEILAAKAGLDPADYRRQPADPNRSRRIKSMRRVLEMTADFYQQQLLRAIIDDAPVGKYYKQRGLNRETCINFRVGYAPSGWQQLVDYLAGRKVSEDLAIEAGLIKKTQAGRLRDQFVDRLIVPLLDAQGGVIGFTGRLINDRAGPKYINSPQTLLYSKSQHVFGYSQAKAAIGRSGHAVVVEGNLDVLMAHQAGYQTVVAAGGTALTADHFKTISRLAGEIRLAFDGDRAGVKATEKAISLVAQTASSLMVIPLPSGRDPDDLIRHDPKLWQRLYDSPQPALDWLYEQYQAQLDLKTAAGKRRLTDVMLAVVGHLNDSVETDHYLAKLTEIGSSRQAIDKKYEVVRQQILDQRERAKTLRRSPRPRTTTRSPRSVAGSRGSGSVSAAPARPKPLKHHEYKAREMLSMLMGNLELVEGVGQKRFETLGLVLKPELVEGYQLLVDYRHYLDKGRTKSGETKDQLIGKIQQFHREAFGGRQAGATVDDLNKDALWQNLEKYAASLSKQ